MRRISLLCVTCAAAMMVAGGCASMSGTLKGGLIGGGGGTAVGAGIGWPAAARALRSVPA